MMYTISYIENLIKAQSHRVGRTLRSGAHQSVLLLHIKSQPLYHKILYSLLYQCTIHLSMRLWGEGSSISFEQDAKEFCFLYFHHKLAVFCFPNDTEFLWHL